MGVKVNNTNKTFDEYNFDNFFNVSNLYNFDTVYVTKKDIFSDGLSIGKYSTFGSTNYNAYTVRYGGCDDLDIGPSSMVVRLSNVTMKL